MASFTIVLIDAAWAARARDTRADLFGRLVAVKATSLGSCRQSSRPFAVSVDLRFWPRNTRLHTPAPMPKRGRVTLRPKTSRCIKTGTVFRYSDSLICVRYRRG